MRHGHSLMKAALLKMGIVSSMLLLASGTVLAASTVTLTAAPTSTILPDGQVVPMWGYSCGAVSGDGVACTATNGAAQTSGWQPPLITVPSGQTLTITLINNLLFGANSAPTSLMIVGQVGGGLGDVSQRTTMPSPTHAAQGTTWPGTLGGTDVAAGDAVFTPPAQADRVRSFGTEVAAGESKQLTWTNLQPGTYLIESGTEPSIQGTMGLYGVLVVTDSAAPGTAYGKAYDKDVPLLLSEIDPVQNNAVNLAIHTAGFSDTLVWNGQGGQCGDPAVHTCYPPVVNYSPLYYLINGVSFDRSNVAASALAVSAAGTNGRVLLRLINAGLHMHVPSVTGSSMTLLAEDSNKLPGNARVQSEVFMAAGKTYDVLIQPKQTTAGTYDAGTYAVYDRALGLSTNNRRDGGMQVQINVAGGAASVSQTAVARPDTYNKLIDGKVFAIAEAARGVIANDTGVYGVTLLSNPTQGAVVLNADGTFTYTPNSGVTISSSFTDSFSYCANGAVASNTCSSNLIATVTLGACTGSCKASAPVANDLVVTSAIASRYSSSPPGVIASVTNASGLALTANPATNVSGGAVTLNPDGSFVVAPACANIAAGCTSTSTVSFNYSVVDSQQQTSNSATVTVNFLAPSGLTFAVQDAKNGVSINDYRWIIEEDRTFWIDPSCQINSTNASIRPSSCPPLPVESLGYNFHTASMPVVAQGCVGTVSCEAGQAVQGAAAVCDVGNGACRTDAAQFTAVDPKDVHLDPAKRYYISVLPGDAANPTLGGAGGPDDNGKPFSIVSACGAYTGPTGAWEPGGAAAMCGHAMGGAQIAAGQSAAVNVSVQETPLPTAKVSVFVFQDDNPLNGENDAGGGVDVLAPNEPGLGGFEIKLFDQAGGLGDNTGQITYDMFNQPVSNALAGKIDPITGMDSCPITARTDGLVGMVPTCPTYESDGKTLSPLAGQVVIANLYPGLYEVQAYPAADRIGRGEEWLQTNTLDGGKPHEAFIKPDEPSYFQEFGPGGFHVSIGFANPATINKRKAAYCASLSCNATLNMQVTNNHMSRTPDQRTFSSGNYDHYGFTQCYVSVGPADDQDFAIEKCDADGKVSFANMPTGVYKLTVFDQWNDIMLDGLVGTVTIDGNTATKVFPVTQWRTNLYTRTFIDTNGDGVSQDDEPGLPLVATNIRYRDGSFGFFNNTDLNGYAGFNEVFPFMNWLVVETDSTRYKSTSAHVVYDAGGQVDNDGGANSTIAANLANTKESNPLPTDLRVPGAVYCSTADCNLENLLTNAAGGGAGGSTGAIFPAQAWGTTQGWQGLLGQNTFMEFGVKPFAEGENGGIKGHVIYASTRPFDDPSLSLQLQWEPGIPRVKINLYQETTAEDGSTALTLVDSTATTSWDDWAQGFRRDGNGNLMKDADGNYIPNMNCPGQDATSPFFATLKDSKQWLDAADDTGNKKSLPKHSQFKCYDGWSQLNQAQPAPYDGMYKFPSVVAVDPSTGKVAKTNCAICSATDKDGNPMLPTGKYVVEVVLPEGYELVKEEDKNILLGDVYIAPVTQQFAGFGNIFIMPDQAAVAEQYNANNPGGLNLTSNLGSVTFPRHEGDTGSVESFWPCVGAERIVPDYNSLYPGAGQAAPFAGAKRRLCDRKEVVLQDQASVLAKFFVFSSTHIAGHFTGTITNDFASEFDPFSPQFGEKFGPPNLPVGIRDFTGKEVGRVTSDQWGIYNGLNYSSWSVNPPNPTGYIPTMMIACMNDPGPIVNANGQSITDPNYNPAYSNFCYEQPFMPGFTTYMDTPVIPTQAFADSYNLPDTEYPNATPAISKVVNSSSSMPQGPWVTPGAAATRATAQFTLSAVTQNDTITAVRVGTTTITGGTVTCNLSILCTGTTQLGQNLRNIAMAAALVNNINARTATTGYSAVCATTALNVCTSATVIVTAPTGTGAELNGVAVTVNQSGVTVTPSTLALAGGTVAVPGSMAVTITALGDKVVQNPNFSGPNATTAPYNQKTLTRHYGFGDRPSACPASGACSSVTVGGVALTNVTTWTDTTISGTVVATGVPACTLQQRGQATAQCGELLITAANGKQSIDAVTVTIGGSAPWMVTEKGVAPPAGKSVKDYSAAFGRIGLSPLQTAIDSADAGDLILVSPGVYRENLIMWKPVRLQGVGAASVTINADAHPAGKMDQWRRQMDCVFGLDLDGVPNLNNVAYDKSGTYSCPAAMHQRVDRIPFEAIVGWDASGNGNLAQVLQEPTLMGAYEGAGITVLGRGVRIPANSTDFWGQNATGGAGAFTDGSVYLAGGNNDCNTASATRVDGRDYGTSNYFCNPSRIDGLSIINSSQGGGGIFIHGWGHHLDVANNRVSANHGTLAGAINLGNGETPDAFINDGVECGVTPMVMPCPPTTWNGYTPVSNATIPFQFNTFVRIHHNMLYDNASIGDALFSGTPAGAGAITVSAGADGYQIDHNWIAGNLSTGDGGGVQHLGLSFQGKINNNYILFNQSTNPTLPTNGGGVTIEGANLDRNINGQECGSTNDQDCPPGLGEGVGLGLVVDANLILGNSAESGSGGGLRLQQLNGSEVLAFPTAPDATGGGRNTPASPGWYDVTVTNNIIANNVAGWDGGGVSMQDALKVTFVNNTVTSNDTTASAGVLFKTLGAVDAASNAPGCYNDPTNPANLICPSDGNGPHNPQPAGLVTISHTANLADAMAGLNVVCPAGFNYAGTQCKSLSLPKLINDMFWQNRAFSVNIVDADGNVVDQGTTTATGSGLQSQQNLIALTPLLNQTATGQCPTGANYWDIGFRGDSGVSNGATKLTLVSSILTSAAAASSTSAGIVVPSGSPVVGQFCNGARMPPEHCSDAGIDQNSPSCKGFNAPPGASETTSLATVFVFNGIKPTATVDEGHNWLNLSYGPLTLNRPGSAQAPELMIASAATGTTGGAYSVSGTSAAVNRGTNSGAPATDFFGNSRARSTANPADIGAVEYQVATGTLVVANPAPLPFTDVVSGATTTTRDLVLTNNGTTTFTVPAPTFTSGFSRVLNPGTITPANCGATLTAGASCTIRVQWSVPTTVSAVNGSVTLAGVSNSPVAIQANTVAPTYTATVNPTTLAFGNWAVNAASTPMTITVTNTGNSSLSNLTYAIAGSNQFTRPSGAAGGTCAPTLAVAASCTVNVALTPNAMATFNGTLTIANTASPAAQRMTALTVSLSGNGVTAVPSLTLTPNPLVIALLSPAVNPLDPGVSSMVGGITITNNAASGGSQINLSAINISTQGGGGFGGANGAFSVGANAGPDTCSGVALAPGASCVVTVRFSLNSPNAFRGGTVNGTIKFTDNATGAPQSVALRGVITP